MSDKKFPHIRIEKNTICPEFADIAPYQTVTERIVGGMKIVEVNLTVPVDTPEKRKKFFYGACDIISKNLGYEVLKNDKV